MHISLLLLFNYVYSYEGLSILIYVASALNFLFEICWLLENNFGNFE
jgi:hypothetical protein